MNKEVLDRIKENFLLKEENNLSPYATKDSDAIRLVEEDNSDESSDD